MAAPIRKLCEVKFALSRPQTCSRARRLLVSDARVRLRPSMGAILPVHHHISKFEERLGGTLSMCLKKIVSKGSDGTDVRV